MTNRSRFAKLIQNALVILICAVFVIPFFPLPAKAAAAVVFLSPSSGTFIVDSTFDVSVYLNTEGNTINTVDLALRYPPDRLQLVSTGTGKSIIGLWTSVPKYNNQTGIVELTGGIPGGVRVERGLITTLTFRVKAVGQAIVKFDRTRILYNDGMGTEALTQTQNSIYDLILPPPAGPIVISDTHPDQTQWYKNNSVSLRWTENSSVDGYSYMISDQPTDVPDEISEGARQDIVYRSLADGRKYFHIRALRDGRWGGTTHFALNIDSSPPAEYKIEIIPNSRTTRLQPVFQFETTDTLSGTDHYELKIVDVKNLQSNGISDSDEVFFEANSPYVAQEMALGDYDVIVRAYDKAGNYREVTERLEIVPVLLRYVSGGGIAFGSTFVIPWWIVLLILAIIILLLYILGRRMHKWHDHVDRKRNTQVMPPVVVTQMEELQRYREKYGKLAAIVLLALSVLAGSGSVNAQVAPQATTRQDVFEAPIITTISENITNEEIFYVGGLAGSPNADVILYIQNTQSAETISETIPSDKNGEWFYRHDAFLSSGGYVLWAQSKRAEQMSPPSPQMTIYVEETAVQFGATRISYAMLYMILFAISLFLLLMMLWYVIYHAVHGRRKHTQMLKEITEAQESLRRGFAVLNRDIQAELDLIRRTKLSQKLSIEQKEKESQLLKDMQEIEQYMSKEIWDIENAEHVR